MMGEIGISSIRPASGRLNRILKGNPVGDDSGGRCSSDPVCGDNIVQIVINSYTWLSAERRNHMR